jgi:hypothetical protein
MHMCVKIITKLEEKEVQLYRTVVVSAYIMTVKCG